jgi:diketogulonate reductase-like aldo/keto reductase
MEEIFNEGKARALGVSNFDSKELELLTEFAQVKPAVLQVRRGQG